MFQFFFCHYILISLSRALSGSPEILVLDDSSSALDYKTDAALRRALRQLPETTTTFIVSQRTSSIQHADQILVLDRGRVAEMGTHETLKSAGGIYQKIYETQSGREEVQA